jgi:hypothetical protein
VRWIKLPIQTPSIVTKHVTILNIKNVSSCSAENVERYPGAFACFPLSLFTIVLWILNSIIVFGGRKLPTSNGSQPQNELLFRTATISAGTKSKFLALFSIWKIKTIMTLGGEILMFRSCYMYKRIFWATFIAVQISQFLELTNPNERYINYSGPSNFERSDVPTTRNSNKESRGRHVIAFSLWLVACAVARSVLPWLVQWASRKFSLFLNVLYIFGLFLCYLE